MNEVVRESDAWFQCLGSRVGCGALATRLSVSYVSL